MCKAVYGIDIGEMAEYSLLHGKLRSFSSKLEGLGAILGGNVQFLTQEKRLQLVWLNPSHAHDDGLTLYKSVSSKDAGKTSPEISEVIFSACACRLVYVCSFACSLKGFDSEDKQSKRERKKRIVRKLRCLALTR